MCTVLLLLPWLFLRSQWGKHELAGLYVGRLRYTWAVGAGYCSCHGQTARQVVMLMAL